MLVNLNPRWYLLLSDVLEKLAEAEKQHPAPYFANEDELIEVWTPSDREEQISCPDVNVGLLRNAKKLLEYLNAGKEVSPEKAPEEEAVLNYKQQHEINTPKPTTLKINAHDQSRSPQTFLVCPVCKRHHALRTQHDTLPEQCMSCSQTFDNNQVYRQLRGF